MTGLTETEAGFLTWVIDRAHASRWRVMHPRPARTASGWATPVQGDGAGWPDLVLVRDRIVYAELKRAGAGLDPDQRAWRDRLIAAGGEWYLWRPADRPAIERILG